jgi:hypothetical protein
MRHANSITARIRAARFGSRDRSAFERRHVFCDVADEFIERRHPAAVTLIDHWLAALVDDPAKLRGRGLFDHRSMLAETHPRAGTTGPAIHRASQTEAWRRKNLWRSNGCAQHSQLFSWLV